MPSKPKSVSAFGNLAKSLRAELEATRPPERKKRTLVIEDAAYQEFERVCRELDRYPSEVIETFIKRFLEQER